MNKYLFALITLLLAACNAAVINLQNQQLTQEALGTDFGTQTPRSTLRFPTISPTSTPTRAYEIFAERSIEINGYTVDYQPVNCDVTFTGQNLLECGRVSLPENRNNPDGRRVTLPVVIVRSNGYEIANEPVFYLAGGGGSDAISGLDFYVSNTAAILDTHDYIFYSQRGAPGTEPSLSCSGYSNFLRNSYAQDMSSEEFDQAHVTFLHECYANLLEAGNDLSQYNSLINAADLNDLRIILGYEKINIFGSSYGTKLGLTAMREYPEMIHSAVLDSVYPLESDLYVEYPANALRAFDLVFEECAQHEHCSERSPNLEDDFYAVVDRLNEQPITLELQGTDFVLNGDRFLFLMTFYFYGDRDIASVPWAIYTTNRESINEIARRASAAWQVDFLSWGMFFTMQCHEEIPYSSRAAMDAANAAVPSQYAGFFGSSWRFDLCDGWESGLADPIANQAVISDIPALVFAGHYDLETPPEWGLAVSQNLSNSYFFEFPNTGHGVVRSVECALEITTSFFNNPNQAPESQCFADQTRSNYR